ncbi:MAG: 4Fe-4S binding protein [Clostridiales bacterium]|nr:4Fe-4S binding protein [Clostridiales bacterium]
MDKTIQKIVDDNKCTGCQLCYNVCDFDAIHIELSSEGFYVPRINFDKCINCGKCLKYCPIENDLSDYNETINVYAAKSNDEETRMKSSSGGIFSELAKEILKQQGIVFGTAFNENNRLVHIDIDSKKDLKKLCGSKYLQSDINLSYKKAKNYLADGEKVMFIGTPCQASALRNYIIDNDNLLIVDLVCHGVPSIKVFGKYLKYIFEDEKIKNIYFRDKQEEGWKNYYINLVGEESNYKKSHRKDPFLYGFLKNLYLNKICYDCPFSKIPRVSDITLGDFWGVNQELDDNKGTSLVIVNSNKGQEIIDNLILNRKISVNPSDIISGSKQNPRVIDGNMNIPKGREKLFKEIENLTFKEMDNLFIKSPKKEILQYAVKSIQTKPIVIFGTGSGGLKVFDEVKKIGIKEFKYFVDNDEKKEGTIFCGKKIYKPEKLLLDKKDKIFIIVASFYYDEISNQLINMGFREDVDFVDGISYFL